MKGSTPAIDIEFEGARRLPDRRRRRVVLPAPFAVKDDLVASKIEMIIVGKCNGACYYCRRRGPDSTH